MRVPAQHRGTPFSLASLVRWRARTSGLFGRGLCTVRLRIRSNQFRLRATTGRRGVSPKKGGLRPDPSLLSSPRTRRWQKRRRLRLEQRRFFRWPAY
jgi:hypothetical protein